MISLLPNTVRTPLRPQNFLMVYAIIFIHKPVKLKVGKTEKLPKIAHMELADIKNTFDNHVRSLQPLKHDAFCGSREIICFIDRGACLWKPRDNSHSFNLVPPNVHQPINTLCRLHYMLNSIAILCIYTDWWIVCWTCRCKMDQWLASMQITRHCCITRPPTRQNLGFICSRTSN